MENISQNNTPRTLAAAKGGNIVDIKVSAQLEEELNLAVVNEMLAEQKARRCREKADKLEEENNNLKNYIKQLEGNK